MNQGWENFDEYKIDKCQCVHSIVILVIIHIACFYIAISIYSHIVRKSLIPVCTYICTCISQPHLFWVATGYMRAWQMKRDITSQHVHWFVHVLL